MANFDPDRLLNLERRTGVKSDEIDDFVRKATDLEQAIRGLKEGTVDPDKIKIEGIETEEEKKQKEAELEERRRKYREKEEQLRLQRKKEERERWWNGAELFRPATSDGIAGPENKKRVDANTKDLLRSRYTADYSKWETWTPDDAVSLQEQKEKEAEEEKKRNEEFEKNNPEFVENFLTDMKARKKEADKKQETAEVLRLKGNKFFKAKDFEQALSYYMDALKNTPFDAKLLLNIAQSYIKLKNLEDAEEFLKRTLYLDEKNVKALSRKAFVSSELGQYSSALETITKALALDPTNVELLTQQKEIAIMEKEEQLEKQLRQQLSLSSNSSNKSSAAVGQSEVDHVVQLLGTFVTVDSTAVPVITLQGLQSNPDQLKSFRSSLTQIYSLLRSIRESVEQQPLMAIYFRQQHQHQGMILLFQWMKLLQSLSSGWAALFPTTEVSSYEEQQTVNFAIMFAFIDEKRASKQQFVEGKMYSFYKECLLQSMSEECLSLQEQIVKTLHSLVKDEIFMKAKTLVFADSKIWAILGEFLGNMMNNAMRGVYPSFSPVSSSSGGPGSPSVRREERLETILRTIEVLSLLVKEFFFSSKETDKTAIKSLETASNVSLVFSLGTTLHYLSRLEDKIPLEKESSRHRKTILELLIDCFVAFSQYETLKKWFVSPLPTLDSSEARELDSLSEVTVIAVLVEVITRFPQFSVNGIAILMNAAIEITTSSSTAKELSSQQIQESNATSLKVKQIITANKAGVDLALSVLSRSDNEQNPLLKIPVNQTIHDGRNQTLIEEVDGIYYTRRVGLLSRLITTPVILQTITSAVLPKTASSPCNHYDHLFQLCENLRRLVRANHSDGSPLSKEKELQISQTPKWITDLQMHYVRIIAHLFAQQDKVIFSSEDMKKVLYDSHFLSSLLYLLPMPRMDCGEITETSVTLVPRFPSPDVLIGNVVHILLAFVKEPSLSAWNQSLYLSPSFFTVEKAICAMATCQDMRVRKNLAIFLARGCQLDGKIREKVTKFRGMQMMLELQREL